MFPEVDKQGTIDRKHNVEFLRWVNREKLIEKTPMFQETPVSAPMFPAAGKMEDIDRKRVSRAR